MHRAVIALSAGLLILPCVALSEGSGAGVFGEWITDRFGVPAYEYTLDETSDPRGEWDPLVAPKTRKMWFHLGNQRIVATAYNHVFVQLFYNESGTKWLNYYEPENLDFAGGFGFILEGDEVFSTLYIRRPEGAEYRRVYGMGYFEKVIQYNGLEIEHVIYAPWTDAPVLVSEVRLRNLTDRARSISYFEYWDVNYQEALNFFGVPVMALLKRPYKLTPRWIPSGQMLVADSNKVWGDAGGFAPKPRLYDPEQPSLFLAALQGEVSGYEFDQRKIFSEDTGWLAGPAALRSISKRDIEERLRDNDDNCLVLRQDVDLSPGGDETLRFVFGYAKSGKPEEIAAGMRGRDDLFRQTMTHWKDNIPVFEDPPDNYLAREVQWSYYSLEALSLIDGYYESRFIPQGGHYLYTWGLHGATRDFAAFAQTMAYYDPGLAKSQLCLMMGGQDGDGRLFYEMIGFGKKNLWIFRPSDLDLWLIWAAMEYVLATRDFKFLDEVVPFYPKEAGGNGTVYEHLRMSLDHLVNVVGTGEHGLIRLRLSDWNDEMTFLTARNKVIDTAATFLKGESTLNTAMACLILPQLADVAEARADMETAVLAREFTSQLIAALQAQWREPGWLNRSYSGLGYEYGDREFYLEPQVWALLAGNVFRSGQEETLIGNIREYLMEPSKLGMMISISREGSLTTKVGEQEEGGIWFAINGPGIAAISLHDGELAYNELKKNTLRWHAETYPELWMGIWSGPDAFNSVYSERPGETWTLGNSSGPQEYPVMNAHPHAQILYAIAHLAGLNGTPEGYTIDPKIPSESFSFRSYTASIERSHGSLKGSFTFQDRGEIPVKVRVPEEWKGRAVEARVKGKLVEAHLEEGFLEFDIPFEERIPVTWIITPASN